MKTLALEFSSPQRSVAVVETVGAGHAHGDLGPERGEHRMVLGAEVVETGARATDPLGMIDAALRQAHLEREQIERVVVGLGPGSYNGIRLSIAVTQGWQLARSAERLRVLGISSAEAIAAEAQQEGIRGCATVVIDAQRNEFYVAMYDLDEAGIAQLERLRLANLAEVRSRYEAGEPLIGPEVSRWFERARLIFPRASTLGRLSLGRTNYISGEQLEPIYLRETKFVKAPPRTLRF